MSKLIGGMVIFRCRHAVLRRKQVALDIHHALAFLDAELAQCSFCRRVHGESALVGGQVVQLLVEPVVLAGPQPHVGTRYAEVEFDRQFQVHVGFAPAAPVEAIEFAHRAATVLHR